MKKESKESLSRCLLPTGGAPTADGPNPPAGPDRATAGVNEIGEPLQSLFDTVDDLIFVLDEEGIIQRVNRAVERRLGYRDAELRGRSVLELHPPAQRAQASALVAGILRGTVSLGTVPLASKADDVFEVEIQVTRGCWQNRKALFCVARDVTERHRTEAQFRLQHSALEAAANGIVLCDREGIILWANPAFATLSGYSRAEVVGQNTRLLNSGKHEPAFFQQMWQTLLAGNVWHGEVVNRRKDGTPYDEALTITPVRDAGGDITHFMAIKQDITQRKQLERHRLQAQRLESIGTLASGLAHDLNNILTPILLASQLLRRNPAEGRKLQLLDRIDRSVKRGTDVLRQVLTFARGAQGARIPVHPAPLIREVARLCEETFPRNIQIRCVIPNELDAVVGDPTQIHQVLFSLCVNARDAMPDSGVLTLEAANRDLDEAAARQHREAKPGRYVAIAVRDTGTGMSAEVLDRLFEPFFTTKPQGTGTGLGLATARGIVNSHGGFTGVCSTLGAGSTFTVFLPVSAEMPRPTRVELRSNRQGQGEWILVVDDDEAVRTTAVEALEEHGYRVLAAADGPAGLALFTAHRGQVVAAMLDVMMPGMDGITLGRALLDTRPDLGLLIVSGCGTGEQQTWFQKLGVQRYLRKLFTTDELLAELGGLIESKARELAASQVVPAPTGGGAALDEPARHETAGPTPIGAVLLHPRVGDGQGRAEGGHPGDEGPPLAPRL